MVKNSLQQAPDATVEALARAICGARTPPIPGVTDEGDALFFTDDECRSWARRTAAALPGYRLVPVEEWERLETEARAAALEDGYASFHADNFSDPIQHTPHRGNHIGYACGFSGPHCWACNEPWPCRAEKARAALSESHP